jgi:hypothetical protein
MGESYLKGKAAETAISVANRHGIEYAVAYRVTEAVWREARAALLKVLREHGCKEWHRLSLKDKSEVCGFVIKGLMDKRRLMERLSGGKKGLV